MKKTNCDYEQTIIASKLNDSLTAEQEKHIKNCPICTDSLLAFSWMKNFDKISNKEQEHILPDSENIWKQALSPATNKKELIKKAMVPLTIAQFASYIIAFFGIVFLLFGKGSFLSSIFGEIANKSSFINSLTAIFNSFTKTLPFLIVPLGMVSFLLISYFIYSIFDPENA